MPIWILRQTLRFEPPVFAGVPLAFTLDLSPGAVDQQVQGAVRTTSGNVDLQGLLGPRQRAEVGDYLVRADQSQQPIDEPGRLPQRHPEQRFHRHAGLDRSSRAAVRACRSAQPPSSWRGQTRSPVSHGT